MGGRNQETATCDLEEGPHQNVTMLAPWSWISSLQNCEKYISVVYKPSVYGILLEQPELRQEFWNEFYKEKVEESGEHCKELVTVDLQQCEFPWAKEGYSLCPWEIIARELGVKGLCDSFK